MKTPILSFRAPYSRLATAYNMVRARVNASDCAAMDATLNADDAAKVVIK